MATSEYLQSSLKIARSIQVDADTLGIGRPPPASDLSTSGLRRLLERFDEAVTSSELTRASRQLFADGHYARAVEEAFKCLNNTVKDKSGISSRDGAKLMRTAFSANSPMLKLNVFKSQSDIDEQLGYMDLFAGSMTGIRNPRAHEHGLTDDAEVALELLILANHLMRKLGAATRSQS